MSPTGRYTTAVPLLFVLSCSAVKEIIEDYVSCIGFSIIVAKNLWSKAWPERMPRPLSQASQGIKNPGKLGLVGQLGPNKTLGESLAPEMWLEA